MRHDAFPEGVTRAALIAWYRSARERTRALFELITPDAYYDRPIALRNPIVFYEGHLPAFCVNTLIKAAQGRAGIDQELEVLFARGIDPESEAGVPDPASLWPSRETVQEYARRADELVVDALANGNIEDDDNPLLRAGEATLCILEHELMHQETLLYMLHNLPFEKKVARAPLAPAAGGAARRTSPSRRIRIPSGRATLGRDREEGFGWDNELPRHTVGVDAFEIDAANVTNGDYLEFVEATAAAAPHFWVRQGERWFRRGMFALEPLPLDAPVYVTHDQAEAYARWKGGRLPTEAEYHRAAFGTPEGKERSHPWGEELPDATRGNFDFREWDPVAVGSFPAGTSAWGVEDLVGNGWEWTSTVFTGFKGFVPMPSYPVYSADFFDQAHYVLKGASPVTARELVRRSFRNWFRPAYPYVFATFRCAATV